VLSRNTIDLSGRNALVTGAAGGIGRAAAHRLAAAGASVVATDTDPIGLATTVEQADASGSTMETIVLDVTDWSACCTVAERLDDRIDTVVAAAGVWTIAPFSELQPEDWGDDIGVNLQGTLQTVRSLLPSMLRRGTGCVITIASDAGRVGASQAAVYAAAKAGVIGFTKALAAEVGRHGIRVNCVSPGPTETAGAAAALRRWTPERIHRRIPLGRLGQPDDIADAILFLASDLAGWITGQTLPVNGGDVI